MTSKPDIIQLSLSLFFLLLPFLSNANGNTNVIDKCWRQSGNWAADRQRLALCSVGFAGKMRQNRGRGLTHYTVTDPTDHPLHPRPGTLRYGATMLNGKVWLTFHRDMQIKLERPLLVSSFTTIDGRGADVHIAYGAGFLIYHANSVIVHGLLFHHNHPMPVGPVAAPGGETSNVGSGDGDAIRIVSSKKIWLDHNTLYQGYDGLLDVTRGSTKITVSNNWFRDHDKVMLLGHDDGFVRDRSMQVTVVLNRFGPNCNQRMPRIRHGYAHVVNNMYDGWKDYAIGGSMNPSVKSQANLFIAPKSNNKGVIWKQDGPGRGTSWNLRSVDDVFVNGGFFKQVGKSNARPHYNRQEKFFVAKPQDVRSLTKNAGALRCHGRRC